MASRAWNADRYDSRERGASASLRKYHDRSWGTKKISNPRCSSAGWAGGVRLAAARCATALLHRPQRLVARPCGQIRHWEQCSVGNPWTQRGAIASPSGSPAYTRAGSGGLGAPHLDEDDGVGAREPAGPQVEEQPAGGEGEGRAKGGGRGARGDAIVPCVSQDQDHAVEAGGFLLEGRRPYVRLGVRQASNDLQPDANGSPPDHSVDSPPIERLVTDRDLRAPAPVLADTAPRTPQGPELADVAEWRSSGEGANADVQTDHGRPTCELDWIWKDPTALPERNQLMRGADAGGNGLLGQATLRARVQEVANRLVELAPGAAGCLIDEVPAKTHAGRLAARCLPRRYETILQVWLAVWRSGRASTPGPEARSLFRKCCLRVGGGGSDPPRRGIARSLFRK